MALEPITRQEKIIAGQDLTPITRMEKFLKQFGGGGGGLPTGGAPYQQLVTDGEGNAKWEDRLAYRTGDSITWDGDTTGLVQISGTPFFKVSDKVFTASELVGAEVSLYANGVAGRVVMTENDISEYSGYIRIGEYAVSVSELSEPLESTGTYFAKTDEATYVSGLRVGGSVVPMDMSFLPLNELESRFSDRIIMTSSTEGSTKKFKITVDDSGTISATEVLA